jgi:hypothetical protein
MTPARACAVSPGQTRETARVGLSADPVSTVEICVVRYGLVDF